MSKVFNPQNLFKLEADKRYKALPPVETISKFNISSDSIVADVGCGTGYFSIPMAQICDKGEVLAFDIEQSMIDFVNSRREQDKLINLHTGLMQAEKIPLSDNTCDVAFNAFVLHEVPDYRTFIGELLRITKPGGKVVVLEWDTRESPFGPPMDHRLESNKVKDFFPEGSYASIEKHSVGEWFYAIVAVKPA